jgi:hypothetical protein
VLLTAKPEDEAAYMHSSIDFTSYSAGQPIAPYAPIVYVPFCRKLVVEVLVVVVAEVAVVVVALVLVSVVVVVVLTSRLNATPAQSGMNIIFSFGAITTPENLRPRKPLGAPCRIRKTFVIGSNAAT